MMNVCRIPFYWIIFIEPMKTLWCWDFTQHFCLWWERIGKFKIDVVYCASKRNIKSKWSHLELFDCLCANTFFSFSIITFSCSCMFNQFHAVLFTITHCTCIHEIIVYFTTLESYVTLHYCTFISHQTSRNGIVAYV